MMKILLSCILCCLGLLVGCKAYHWGTPGDEGVNGLYIAPVVNQTATPQVRALLTEQLRRTFGQSVRWKLETADQAPYQLVVELVEVRQKIAATQEDDTGRGISFTRHLVARATLTGLNGVVVKIPEIPVEGIVFSQPGLPESAYQALPGLTQRLAEQIYQQVTFDF